MGTRGIIGTAHDSGFTGRYVHMDAYPSWTGARLLEAYAALGSAEAVIEHAVRPGEQGFWSNYAHESAGENGIWRAEDGEDLVSNLDDVGAEWAYLLDTEGFTCAASMRPNGKKAVGMFGSVGGEVDWLNCGRVLWTATEPDWEHIECGDDLERCIHYAWKHFPEAKGTRVGTAAWLGRERPSFSCLSELIDNKLGRRLKLSGSGGISDARAPRNYFVEEGRPRYWWVSVEDGPDVRAARVIKAGYKLERRYTGVVRTAAGELLVPAGEVLQ
jgi:hypothetical protein